MIYSMLSLYMYIYPQLILESNLSEDFIRIEWESDRRKASTTVPLQSISGKLCKEPVNNFQWTAETEIWRFKGNESYVTISTPWINPRYNITI